MHSQAPSTVLQINIKVEIFLFPLQGVVSVTLFYQFLCVCVSVCHAEGAPLPKVIICCNSNAVSFFGLS
jgi:hypothetical protein